MSSVPSDLPGPGDEAPSLPSPESARLWMTRRLLRSAVRCYQMTLAFSHEVNNSAPANLRHRDARERDGWERLKGQANDAFDAAEVQLATRIVNLYDDVAPEPNRIPTRDDDVFQERAIRLGGVTFVLTYDPANYQPETGIVAMLPADLVVDLDD